VLNNRKIVESPIILFLGAGASASLGKPMMAEFVEKVAKVLKNSPESGMLHELQRFRGNDLEAILGELDTIIDLDYADSIHGTLSEGGNRFGFSLERDMAKHLRIKLKHEIIKEYRNVDSEKAVELYTPLFDVLFRRLAPSLALPIFTTNYDPAIEEFCNIKYSDYALCDGFEFDPAARHLFWSRFVFDRWQPDANKRNLILFKLHGSTDWLKVRANNRIRRGQAMYDAMDSDAYENILIYPATRKIATDEPFYTGYEYFERCCEKAKLCIAVGYSFRDYDALTRLRGAVSMNDNLRIVLIGPSAEEVLKRVAVPESRKFPMSFKFGEKSGDIEDLEAIVSEFLVLSKFAKRE
jgi:hypothetical protein